jgi:hypothetical protein
MAREHDNQQRFQVSRVTPQALFEAARSDSVVATFVHGWQAGSFPSLEAMLVSLVVQLSEEKARLLENAIQKELLQPPQTLPVAESRGGRFVHPRFEELKKE